MFQETAHLEPRFSAGLGLFCVPVLPFFLRGEKNTSFFFHNFMHVSRGGRRGHYERGLFTGGISRISKISRFSRIL